MTAANRRATVSLVMIVRNEARQLAECLDPVAPLFDEIVVVDTGSQDATKEVAARYTSRIFDFPWCDDFSAARNEALRHATGDWVMWLDADDRLTPQNLQQLSELLNSLDMTPRAYLMNTACWTEFACEGHTLISHPRLFSRRADLRWEGRVHEQLRSASGALQLEGVFSDVVIDHFGYTDRALQQRKLQRNLRLLRMDFALNPDSPSALMHLGMTYYQLGRWDDAETFFTRLLDGQPAIEDHLRQVFGALAQMAMRRGDVQRAVAAIKQGLAHFPDDEHLLYLASECLYELDRYEEAIQALDRIIRGAGQHYQGGVPGDIRSRLAPRKLADVLRLKRDFAGAERLLLPLLEQYPDDTHSWHTLGRVYLDSGHREALQSVVERMRSCPQGEIFGRLLLALWHLNHQELAATEEHIDWLIGNAPQMPLPRVLRVELLGRQGASIADRIHACHDVLRVQPGNVEIQRVLQAFESQQRSSDSPNFPLVGMASTASA